MADQKIELPNGDQLLFPAEMPDAEIQTAIEQEYPQFKASSRSTLPTFDQPAAVQLTQRGLSTPVTRAQDILVDRAYATAQQPVVPEAPRPPPGDERLAEDTRHYKALHQQQATQAAQGQQEVSQFLASGASRVPEESLANAMEAAARVPNEPGVTASGPERYARDFASGELGSTGAFFDYLGAKTGFEPLSAVGKSMGDYAKGITPRGQKFADRLASGLGSFATFYIPGLGVQKGVQLLSAIPRLAQVGGATAMAGLESAMEAGSVYDTLIQQGKTHQQAVDAADKAFMLNLPVILVTDKIAFFNNFVGPLKQGLVAAGTNAVQEAYQQGVSNTLTDRPLTEGMGESALIGSIIGGGAGAVQGMGTPPSEPTPQPSLRDELAAVLSGPQKATEQPAEPTQPEVRGTPAAPVKVTAPEDVAQAAQRVNLQPTEAQKEAGNYAKAHVSWNGLSISIENPAGSERSGKDSDGEVWSVTMPNDYGYIKRTEGADGDHIDVYLGPNVGSPNVFIVDQIDPATGKFDEHKNMLGFDSVPEAITAYQAGFSDGRGASRMGAITQVSLDDFKAWLKDGKTTKAVTYVNRQKAKVKNVQPTEIAQAEIHQEGVEAGQVIPGRGDLPIVYPSDPRGNYGEQNDPNATAPSPALGIGDGTRTPEDLSLDRRHASVQPAEEHRQAERRTHPTERKNVAEMTPAELRYALLTDHLTDTNNRRAYEEAAKLPIQASVDVDSLKWVNDNLGHAAGDQLLQTVAAALKAQTGETYHISGDEFIVQGRTVRAVNVALKAAQEALRTAKLEATDQAGNKTVLNGVGFSYGTGKTLAVAEEGLHAAKASRERAGLRAARGETPPGAIVTPKEIQNAQAVRSNEGQVRARRTQGQPRVQRSPEQGGGDLQQPASRPAGEQQTQAVQKAQPAPAIQVVAKPAPIVAKPATGLQSIHAPLEVLVKRVTPAQSTLGRKINLRPAITRARELMNGTRTPSAADVSWLNRHAKQFEQFEPQAAQALREISAIIKPLLAQQPTTVQEPLADYLVGGREALKQAVRDNLRNMLHNPTPEMIALDIRLNRLLGGDNETLSARIGKAAKTGNPVAEVLAKGLDNLDPGHIERALENVQKEVATHLNELANAPKVMLTETLWGVRYADRTTEPVPHLKADDLIESIRTNGVKEPVTILVSTKDNLAFLSDGNHRVTIAHKLGVPTVPVRIERTSRSFTDEVKAKAKAPTALGITQAEINAAPEVSAFESRQPRTAPEEIEFSSPSVAKEPKAAYQTKAPKAQAPAPIFYSQLAKQIAAAPDRIFQTGRQVAAWLESNAPKLGIKKDEIEATGIKDWLKLQGKVSKAEVQQFLDENGVKVEEVVLGAESAGIELHLRQAEKKVFDAHLAAFGPRWAKESPLGQTTLANLPWWVKEIAQGVRVTENMNKLNSLHLQHERKVLMLNYGKAMAARDELLAKNHLTTRPKFASYQLPGGENYRELLLTLPEKEPRTLNEIAQEVYGKRFSDLGDDEANRVAGQETREKKAQNFKSSHFPNQPNILAHIRFNERTDADGNKVLFIEELQSDWGQKGKKEGFLAPDTHVEERTQIKKQISDLQDDALLIRLEAKNGDELNLDKRYSAIKDEIAALDNKLREIPTPHGQPLAPFVTDTKSWTALSLKRMIRYAAENGFDKIAWTTGEQQAERYDLSKTIGSVETKEYAGRVTLTLNGKNGEYLTAQSFKNYDDPAIEEFIGKDLAKKIVGDVAASKHQPDRTLKYSGLDLKVGVEGMKGYYDQIVPQVANNILKKIGGGEVENVSIDAGTMKTEADGVSRFQRMEQPSFAITPEMRSTVLGEGLALFEPGANYDVSAPAQPGEANTLAVRQDPESKDVYHVTAELVSVGTRTLPTKITTIEDAAQAFAYQQQYAVEHYDAIVTDASGKPLAIIGSFKGTATQTPVFPATVLQELALIPGAKMVWATHNHPSGLAEFSSADRTLNNAFADYLSGSGVLYKGLFAMTRRNQQTQFAFVSNMDNAIENQILRPQETGPARKVRIQERMIAGEPTEFAISAPQDAKRYVPQVAKGNAGILLLSAQHHPVAFIALNPKELFPLRENNRWLKLVNRIAKTNAGAAFLVNPNDTISSAHLENLAASLKPLDIRVLDAISYKYDPDGGVRDTQSLVEKGTFNPPPFFLSKKTQAALDESSFADQRAHQTTPYEALARVQKEHPTWMPAITKLVALGKQGKRGGLILNSQIENLQRAAELIAEKRGVPVESILPEVTKGISFSQGGQNVHLIKLPKVQDAIDFAEKHGGRLAENTDGSWTVSYVGEVPAGDTRSVPIEVDTFGFMSKTTGWTSGFYSPELGISFVNTDHLSPHEVPGILVHEILHQTATDKATLDLGKEVLKRIGAASVHGDIYLRVKARMEQAGVVGDANEAANYLVEEAMNMGSQAGHSYLDQGFWAWAQKALPRTALLTLKRWVAALRAALYKHGLIVKAEDLRVDDIAAVAVGNMSELAAGKREAASEVIVNIGLAVNDGTKIAPETAKAALEKTGAQIISSHIRQSNTEPTLIAKLSRPLTPTEADRVSTTLKQEAIAQRVDGVGELYGPQAENWKPFNPDYFLELQAKLKEGEVPPLKATHFSNEKRTTLSGKMYGTGLRGAEQVRLAEATDPRIKTRISFYVDEGKGVFPETGVGHIRHDVTLTNLYDGAKNPLRLPSKSFNDFESAVLDHGFSGYYIKEGFTRQGVAVLLGDAAQRVEAQTQAPTTFQQSLKTLTEDTKEALETAAFNYVDEFGPLEKWQKTLGKVPPDQDAHMAQQRYSGVVAARVEDFHDDMVNPLLEAIHASGLPYQEVEQYLYAKHAPSRNAEMEKINPGQTNLSGMTDEEAADIIRQAEQDGSKPALDAMAKQVYAITAKTRENLVQGELMTSDERKTWEAKYKNYVPLHRDEVQSSQPPTGKGFSIKGPESKRALGSEKEATNILAHTLAQHEASIIRVEKNKVSRAMFELLSAHPDSEVGEIDSPDIKKVLDKSTGTVAFRVDPFYKNQPHVLVLKIDGEEHTVSFNTKKVPAQRMAYAFKNLGGKELGEVTILVGKFTRFLATMSTSANPVFLARNFQRDLQTAAVNLNDTPIKNKAQVFWNVPAAMRGFYAMSKDNLKSPWAKHAREFRDAGGQVGWMAQYKDIEDRSQHYKDLVNSMRPGVLAASERTMKLWWSLIEDANAAVENAVRLSAYVTARKEGISEAEAAMIAKNLTVNFNIRGAKSVELNMWYMFAKASINGTARMFRAAKHPKVRKIMAGMVVVGFLMDALARGLAGDDDDDGENDYDQLPEYTKSNNWVFWVSGRPVTIPEPYGLNFFPNVGRKVSQLMFQKGYHAPTAALDILEVALNNYSPVGSGGSLLQTVAPTIADPFIQLAENKNFAGQPIYKEQFGFGPDKPEYQMGFKSSSMMSQLITEWLNNNSGGNAERPGMINLNPSVMDFAVASIFGGAGKTYTQALSLPAKLAADKEIEAREIPFVNIFLSAKPQQQVQRKYHEALEQVQTVAAEYKDPAVVNEEWKKAHAAEIDLIGYAKRVEARIKKLNGWEKDLPALLDHPAGLNNLEAQIRAKFPQYEEELDKGIARGKRADVIVAIEGKILEDEKTKWMRDFNKKFYNTVVK